VRYWLLYNCRKVIYTYAQSPELKPIENLWVFLKQQVAKGNPNNRTQLIKFIKEEWEEIPKYYDFSESIKSMRRRLLAVMNTKEYHKKY